MSIFQNRSKNSTIFSFSKSKKKITVIIETYCLKGEGRNEMKWFKQSIIFLNHSFALWCTPLSHSLFIISLNVVLFTLFVYSFFLDMIMTWTVFQIFLRQIFQKNTSQLVKYWEQSPVPLNKFSFFSIFIFSIGRFLKASLFLLNL